MGFILGFDPVEDFINDQQQGPMGHLPETVVKHGKRRRWKRMERKLKAVLDELDKEQNPSGVNSYEDRLIEAIDMKYSPDKCIDRTIIYMKLKGYSTQQIAMALGVSRATIGRYWTQIRKRMEDLKDGYAGTKKQERTGD